MELQIQQNDIKKLLQLDGKSVTTSGKALDYTVEKQGEDGFIIHIDGDSYQVYDVDIDEHNVSFTVDGDRHSYSVKDEQALLLEKMGFKSGNKKSEGQLKAPMPGKILGIRKQEGDEVAAGEPVIILEAMKMENELKAPVSGSVVKLHVALGDSVDKNTVLIEIA